MSVDIGVDIEEIPRFERLLAMPRFLARVYTENERRYILEKEALSAQRAAGMFCAKEAFSKAVGTGLSGFCLHEVEIVRDGAGKPLLMLHGRAALRFGDASYSLSISHSRETAVAVVAACRTPAGL